MYSPKIDEALIRPLYFVAKDRGQPMTEVVSEMIFEALVARQLPAPALAHFGPASERFAHLRTQQQKEAA